MPSPIKQEFDLRLLQLKYLKAKLEMNKGLAVDASTRFAEAFNGFIKNNLSKEDREVFEDITKKSMINNSKKRAEELSSSPPEETKEPTPLSIKKIFRNIAKEAHPDKLIKMGEKEREEKEELFKTAKNAADKKNLSVLYEISEKLGAELPEPDSSQIIILDDEIEKLNKEMKEIKSTASWEWYHAEDKAKEILMVRYIQFIYETCK